MERANLSQQDVLSTMISDALPLLAGRLLPAIICRGSDGGVYLTFDDGPDPLITARLCNMLTNLRCPATFFVTTSRVESAKLLLLKLYDSGFTIGTHGHNHRSLLFASYRQVKEQLELSLNRIEEIIGTRPNLFRPPFGRFNLNALRACAEENIKLVLWSLSVKDWQPTSPDILSGQILSSAKSGDILLLHDHGAGALNMLEALPAVITGLRERGFTLKALPQRGI